MTPPVPCLALSSEAVLLSAYICHNGSSPAACTPAIASMAQLSIALQAGPVGQEESTYARLLGD